MKHIFALTIMLFLYGIISAQNTKSLDLKQVLKEQAGDAKLNNFIVACQSNDAEIRMHRTGKLLDNDIKEYLNGKFNVIYLNNEANKDILSHYEISKFPALLIVDPQGIELSRATGNTPKDLINSIEFAFQHHLTFVDREKKFKENPPYGAKYAYHLNYFCHMPQASERVLLEMLNNPMTDRCFITKGKRAMSELIESMDSPVLAALTAHSADILKTLGKAEYNRTRIYLTSELVNKVYRQTRLHKEFPVFFKLLSEINANKFMACDFSRFLEANNDKFHSFDAVAVYNEYTQHFFKMDIESQLAALNMIEVFAPYKFQKQLNGKYLDFYNLIIKQTKDKRLKELAAKKIKFYNIVK